MKKFQCVPPSRLTTVLYMYHGEIAVRQGIAETDNPLTEMFLLNNGFVEVIEKVDPAPDADAPAQATVAKRSRKGTSTDATASE